MAARLGSSSVPIERIEVSAYKVPTDSPESDGTYEWDLDHDGPGRGRGRRPDRPGLLLRRHGDGAAGPRPAGRRRQGPRRDGRAGRPRGDGRGGAQPGPSRHRVDGDLGRRCRALGPEGAAAGRGPGHPAGSGPRRGAGLRQRRVHLLFGQAAPRPARRLGGRGHPAGEDEDRPPPRGRPPPRAGRPRGRSGPTPSCSSMRTAPTAASRRWPWPRSSPIWA